MGTVLPLSVGCASIGAMMMCEGCRKQSGRPVQVGGAWWPVLCSWCAMSLATAGARVAVPASWAERPPGVGDMPALPAEPVVLYPEAVRDDGPAQTSPVEESPP